METLFSQLAARLAAEGVTRFIVAGGETSGVVTQSLGIKGFHIGPTISPGVPWVNALDKPVSLALKSGNFGDEAFFHEPKESFYHERFRKSRAVFARGDDADCQFILSARICNGSAGNLSLLLPDGNLLATPTGSCLGNLDPQRLSKVTADGEWLSGDKPSKEVLFHLALYRNNPRCKAVVHLHSTWSTALSCQEGLDSNNVIRPFTPYVVMRMGNVPLVPYYRPGDKRIAQDLAELAADNQAFLLANHGPVVCGESLQEAANNMEELEETAKLIFILGDRPIRYLTAGEIAELRS